MGSDGEIDDEVPLPKKKYLKQLELHVRHLIVLFFAQQYIEIYGIFSPDCQLFCIL